MLSRTWVFRPKALCITDYYNKGLHFYKHHFIKSNKFVFFRVKKGKLYLKSVHNSTLYKPSSYTKNVTNYNYKTEMSAKTKEVKSLLALVETNEITRKMVHYVQFVQ